jgi:SOS regulatory protein LexA
MKEGRINKIIKFYKRNRRMPSYSEIMELAGYKTKSAVHYFVKQIIKDGIVSRDKKGYLIPNNIYGEIPFVGLVEAGFPSPAEDELTDTMSLDDYLIENKEATYLMRAKGESMIDAGIVDGDMLLVERTDKTKTGEIVIALVDGERTMKYLRQRAGSYYLEPANKKFKPIFPENELRIEAVVKAVIRKY